MPEDNLFNIKEQRVKLLEQKYTEAIQDNKDIPTDLANKFSLWLQGKVAQAMQLQQMNAPTMQPMQPAQPEQEAS